MSELRYDGPATLDKVQGKALYTQIHKARPSKGRTVHIDLATTEVMDSDGGAWLLEIADHLKHRNVQFLVDGATGTVADFMEFVGPALEYGEAPLPRHVGIVENIGAHGIAIINELSQFGTLIIESIYWTIIAPFEGKGFRWGKLMDEMYEMGVRAFPIVCLMNFLLGLIISMLMAKQAEAYGIQLFVADIVMIGFARELAAIMTAVVVSARTGAAIAAEIATMKVQEEVDALRGMGINVVQFLVSPKLLALLIVLPCLVCLGILSGLLGGAFWGIVVLGFQPSIWINQTVQAAFIPDIFQGMLKTLVFAVGIVLIGCHNGFRVSGGSRGVGLMTTRAVVMDVFMLINIDIIFAAIFYYILE